MGNYFSGIGPLDLISLGLGAYGGIQSGKAADQQNKLSQQAMDQQQNWLNLMWQYQEPDLQRYAQMQSALDPTMLNMLGQLAALGGTPAGTNISLPTMDNPAIKPYLRNALGAPEGSPQREAALNALYWNVDQPTWADWEKDVGNGASWQARTARHQQSQGLQARPGDWAAPSMTIGGQSITVPGATAGATPEGGQTLPNWMQPQEVPTGLQSALTDVPDWRQPFTPEQISAFLEGSDLDVNTTAKQMGGDIASQMARRGLSSPGGTSSYEQNAAAGLANWQRAAQAKARANLMQATVQRGDQLRGENVQNQLTLNDVGRANRLDTQNTFSNLFNMGANRIGSLQGSMDLTPYATMAGNRANLYGQNAMNYGNMAGQSMAGVGNLLGQYSAMREWQNKPTGTNSIYDILNGGMG